MRNAARRQITAPAQPIYKSALRETRVYEGYFRPHSNTRTNTSKLAVLSDDGTSVWIDGVPVLERARQNQGFQNFSRAFTELSPTFAANRIYHIKLEYTNTIHQNEADMDGISLFAYNGGGEFVDPPASRLVVSVPTDSTDHLDADGKSTSRLKVRVTNQATGQAYPNVPVALTASSGRIRDAWMRTDANGDAYVDSNRNGQRDTNEPQETVLTAARAGSWAQVTATVGNSSGSRKVLMHQVTVEDFAQPRMMIYAPDSSQTSLSAPELKFKISNLPAVGTQFTVKQTLYSLAGHEPIAVRTETLPAGEYTRRWSDFFYRPGEAANGRNNDPGEGIYPFQIEVTTARVDETAFDAQGVRDKAPKAVNWKASKSLSIKPRPSNAWELSYNEADGKTYLTYFVDITNGQSTVAPQNVRVDVYDPAYEKKGTIRPLLAPTVSRDGTFTYWLRGEVEVESAGDYHFVCEAQQADVESEGKDRGKWGLEQNARFVSPPYAVFGAKNPGLNPTGVPSNLDTRPAARYAGKALATMGYGVAGASSTPDKWWTPANSGVILDSNADTAFGPAGSSSLPVGPLTAQYNAVWMFIGHGSTVASPNRGQKAFFKPDVNEDLLDLSDGDGTGSAIYSSSTTVPLPAAANRRFVNQLPLAYQALSTRPANPMVAGRELANSRLMFFAGCWTADSSKPTDLPRAAVALGAKTAVGLEGAYYVNELSDTVHRFIDNLKEGKTMLQATDDVQAMYGDWGIFGGAGLDKDGSQFKINLHGATSITLRTVTDTGWLNDAPGGLARYRKQKDAKWGWQ